MLGVGNCPQRERYDMDAIDKIKQFEDLQNTINEQSHTIAVLRAERDRLRECEKLADEFYREVRRVISNIPYTVGRDFSKANELWETREALKRYMINYTISGL